MIKKLVAEFLGTAWLVLGGCGSAVLAAAYPQLGIGFVGVAFAFGLTVVTMAYAVGHISGATSTRRSRWVCGPAGASSRRPARLYRRPGAGRASPAPGCST